MKVNFENCNTLIECVARYLYYKEMVADKDLPVLDLMFSEIMKERFE